MYADPSLIRDKTVRLHLSMAELAILQAAADRCGLQLSTYCRIAAVEKIKELLARHGKAASS